MDRNPVAYLDLWGETPVEENTLSGGPMFFFVDVFFDGCCFAVTDSCNFFMFYVFCFFLMWGWGILDAGRGERWWTFQTTN